jgi:hypothetical protein
MTRNTDSSLPIDTSPALTLMTGPTVKLPVIPIPIRPHPPTDVVQTPLRPLNPYLFQHFSPPQWTAWLNIGFPTDYKFTAPLVRDLKPSKKKRKKSDSDPVDRISMPGKNRQQNALIQDDSQKDTLPSCERWNKFDKNFSPEYQRITDYILSNFPKDEKFSYYSVEKHSRSYRACHLIIDTLTKIAVKGDEKNISAVKLIQDIFGVDTEGKSKLPKIEIERLLNNRKKDIVVIAYQIVFNYTQNPFVKDLIKDSGSTKCLIIPSSLPSHRASGRRASSTATRSRPSVKAVSKNPQAFFNRRPTQMQQQSPSPAPLFK